MSDGCSRTINFAIICILGVLLYRCRQERRPVDCPSNAKWLSKHGVIYIRHRPISIFSDEYSEWKSLAINVLEKTRRFRTVILDCPNNKTSNFTVTQLAAALASTKQTVLTDQDANTGPDFWLKHSSSEENLPHTKDDCAQIAELANQMHPGTVNRIVVTDRSVWDFADSLYFANRTTQENIWKTVERETFVHWKRHGLMTAFMITNSTLCMGIRYSFPSSILRQFKRSFFFEGYPSCLKIKDNSFPILTESGDYQSCWSPLQDMFSLELVLPMSAWRLR